MDSDGRNKGLLMTMKMGIIVIGPLDYTYIECVI
jgi:hypothetical protein